MKTKKDELRITNPHIQPKSRIKTDPIKHENIKIKFEYFYFMSIHCKFFTNFMKNETEYRTKMQEFYQIIIPYISSKTFNEVESENTHCHSIKTPEELEKINFVLSSYSAAYSEFNSLKYDEFGDEDFYQLAGSSGIRLIGVRKGNDFCILFIDFHHLIFPSLNYNNKDLNNYNYSGAIQSSGNLTVISFTGTLSKIEKCLNCEELDKITR
jgi:hypothetical protein